MKDDIAPIVIFIYKREEKFRKLINSLRPFRPKKLFIVADGPKNEEDWSTINKTREVVKEINWNANVLTNFSEVNLGGPIRIPSGLDWVFDQVDKCIILEDDINVEEGFYYFASYILNFYKDDERLGHVAGNNPVTLPNINGDYFFSVKHRTLAWATWKRAWENRIKNIQEISDKDFEKVIHSTLMHRNFANRQIELFKYQKYKQDYPNWDFMWQLNCWMNDLLAVYYKYNLVKNDGNDEHAQHKYQFETIFDRFPPVKKVEYPIIDPPEIKPNYQFIKKLYWRKLGWLPAIYKKIYIKAQTMMN